MTITAAADYGNVFGVVDYVVFISLLFSSTLIGVFFAWKARHKKDAEHFFTGGRKLAVFPVTMSLIASFMSTNTVLGVPAEVYQIGTQYVMQTIAMVVVIVLAAEVFMPVYYDLDITSVNEYLFRRFNSKTIKLAGTIGFLLTTTPYMAVVLYGPAIALSSVIRISISTSILVVGLIVTFYTSIGGIKAVIWTDVLQCMLMFFGIGLVIVQGLIELGGFSEIWRISDEGGRVKIFNMKFDIYNHDNFWNVVAGTTVMWGFNYCVSQTQVQRYLSMRSARVAKRTLYLNLPGIILLGLMAIFSGLVLYVKYHRCDPLTLGIIERHDQLMPYFVMDTLSGYPGLAGLFVACVFSGSLSTLSSGFNALAAITWEDLLKGRMKSVSPEGSIRAVKLIATGYGLLAIAMSFGVGSLGTVIQASLSLSGSLAGPLFGLFSLALFLRFVNLKGGFLGLVAGISVSLAMSLGSIAWPRPKVAMATATDQCPAEMVASLVATGNGSSLLLFSSISSSHFVPYHDEPEGIGRFVHVSYLIMSTAGFLTTLLVGVAVSLLTGGLKENRDLDDRLLSPLSQFLPPFQRRRKVGTASVVGDAKLTGRNGADNEGNNHNGHNINNNNNNFHPGSPASFIIIDTSHLEYIDAEKRASKSFDSF